MAKNLIIFYTDQQRRDSLGCYGKPVARTPNIDAMVEGGVAFRNHYAANPVCMPSRASFMTGRHLQAHRLIDNGIALPKTERTLPGVLVEQGYQTCSIGKLHLTPWGAPASTGYEESKEVWASGVLDDWTGPYYGFQDVQMTIAHGDACFANGAHYGQWVEKNFKQVAAMGDDFRTGKIKQSYKSSLPTEAQHSTWVANQAIEFLNEKGDKPFCLYVSFPNPHHPFVAAEEYLKMFENCDFPQPHFREGEHEGKPFHYGVAMSGEMQHPIDGGARNPKFTDEEWRKILVATYAMIAQIDDNVGRVMSSLKELGLDRNTTTVYTSDHGDFMGDHSFLFKGPYPCRSLLNIPFIVNDPDCEAGVSDAVMSNVDAMPTLLDLLGVPIPDCVQGRSFKDVMQGEPADADHVALVSGWSKDNPIYYHHSVYGDKYRVTYFPNQDDGELYDLEKDPYEFDNLYHKPEHKAVRDAMMLRLLKEIGRAEPAKFEHAAWW